MAGFYLFLDSGPLGIACGHPGKPRSGEIRTQFVLWHEAGATIVLPEIADYEVRRGLILEGLVDSVRRLDSLRTELRWLPIKSEAMRRAADLWAEARRGGRPTADDSDLDGNIILAAQALDFTGLDDELVIITENNRHLGRFAKTSTWKSYLPPTARRGR